MCGKNKKFWKCQCECGKEAVVRAAYLASGKSKSCGCWRGRGGIPKKHTVCIESDPAIKRTYSSWSAMKDRCFNPNGDKYHLYGGNGITVCDRWECSFEDFLSDMGKRPDKTTIGRLDGTKGYCPENCRWETIDQQNSNRSNTRFVDYDGKTVKLIDLCKTLGKDLNLVGGRLTNGWPLEQALHKPVKNYKVRHCQIE